MVDVRPFRGIRYTSWVLKDADQLVCPPYDMGPLLRRVYRARHPYNAVWLEVPEGGADDTAQNNRYTRARDTFNRWMEDRVLVRDLTPVLYVLRQRVAFNGREHTRLALLAVVRLEDYDRKAILPHEHTMPGPIRDRMDLVRACRANFSPIMALYRDPGHELGSLIAEQARGEPVLTVHDTEGNPCDLWIVSEPATMVRIRRMLEPGVLYIADGHHRYEAALAYRNEMRQSLGYSYTGHEAFNYVLMSLVSCEDPGMLVLPYHRVLSDLDDTQVAAVLGRIGEVFDTTPFHARSDAMPFQLVETLESCGVRRFSAGMVLSDGSAHLLSVKQGASLGGSGMLADFDTWLLHEKVLRPALGDRLADHLSYLYEDYLAMEMVRSGESQMAFFMRSVPMSLFESAVSRGLRLPPKSTYFYPKLPTGLVFNSLLGDV